jgi:hypothetical protein
VVTAEEKMWRKVRSPVHSACMRDDERELNYCAILYEELHGDISNKRTMGPHSLIHNASMGAILLGDVYSVYSHTPTNAACSAAVAVAFI